ncbi:MAG: hypothetical protein J6X88_08255 [Bacteroidales bacterium]|nr:hypothetical protein [Bacteroidales bacterium]
MIKHQTKLAALLAVLSLAATSCQKENITEPSLMGIEEGNSSVCVMSYSVDGVAGRISLKTPAEREAFILRMITLAKEGHRVTFRQENNTTNALASKDVKTYSTKDKVKAYAWADEMIDLGYVVTIVYDESTGVYTCTAEI